MIIKNASVFLEDNTFAKKDIYIKDNKITENESGDDIVINAEGLIAIPGLTDIHFHGCVGHDFCDGTHEAIEAMAVYEAQNGITTICPATMTLGEDTLTQIFTTAASYENKKGADFVGINMEGPYLSMAKKGAQNGDYLIAPDAAHFRKMNQLANSLIKLVSFAPEECDTTDFVADLKDEVVLSVAHTNADYETALKAFEQGASHVTHLFNAMPLFTHRAPGVIGAAIDTGANAELICDGVHIHPSAVRAAFKMFGDDHIILISDSMMAAGMPDGQYSLGGQAVTVKGNRAELKDSTIAGSVTNLMKCMTTAVSFGIPLESAVKCAAVNSAKEIGIYDRYGSITPGKYANIVLLDKNLEIKNVILKGNMIE